MPDRLLNTISARGKISLMHYDSAFDVIYPQVFTGLQQDLNVSFLRRQTLRYLDALGHCDFAFESRDVYACAPSLVLLPSAGLPKIVLTGARVPELIDRLLTFAKNHKDKIFFYIKPQKHGNYLIPSAIYLEAINNDVIREAAAKTQIGVQLDVPAAWRLLNFSCGAAEATQHLSYFERADLNWPKMYFSTKTLTFVKHADDNEGLRLTEYTNPVSQRRTHWLWQNNTAADVDRDWGRFLVLSDKRKDILLYDEKRHLLGVPVTVPLPRLLARAITLCCGIVPHEVKLNDKPEIPLPAHLRIHIYKAVPLAIAECLSKKLGQELINHELEPDDNGVIQ